MKAESIERIRDGLKRKVKKNEARRVGADGLTWNWVTGEIVAYRSVIESLDRLLKKARAKP